MPNQDVPVRGNKTPGRILQDQPIERELRDIGFVDTAVIPDLEVQSYESAVSKLEDLIGARFRYTSLAGRPVSDNRPAMPVGRR
jgi:hypothetical protein